MDHHIGHQISNNGSIRPCWQTTRENMWKAFWCNSGSKQARGLPEVERMKLLSRSVLPVATFRMSRWPPQVTISNEIDSVQMKMTSTSLRMRLQPGEEPEAFVRRRARIARDLCNRSGWWSRVWHERSCHWDEHIRRHPDSPAGAMVLWHGADWLRQRRSVFAASNPIRATAWTTTSGRTDTRVRAGYVAKRWDEGIEWAKLRLQ